MNNISRRKFLGTSLALGGAALATQLPFSLSAMPAGKMHKLPLGFQVWTIREELLKDFPGTLRKMAAMGYETVEMCSPPGYGWTPLMKYSGREMLTIVNDAGLKLESTHYGMAELRKNLDERIGFAAESGQKQMILSSFGLPGSATMDDWSILDKKSVPLGKGIVDWKGLFAAAGTGGVKNIFVEMDPVTFAESVRFYNQG